MKREKVNFYFEFQFKVNSYKLESLTNKVPFFEFGFNELVWRLNGEPTKQRLSIYSTEKYTLQGSFLEEDLNLATFQLHLNHPQFDEDKNVAYHRVSESIIDFCTSIKEGKKVVYLNNKLGEIVSECEISFIKVNTNSSIQTGGKEDILKILTEPILKQKAHEMEMYKFLQEKFKYNFKGTKTFTLFNDYFSFYGKCPFYGFASFEVRESDPRYWQTIFEDVLLLKYGVECKEKDKITPKDYWKSLSYKERLSLETDAMSLISASTYYLADFVQPITSNIGKFGSIKKTKSGMKYTEDFCPIHGCWSGDCEDLSQFELYMRKAFRECLGITKEEYPMLHWYQYMSTFYLSVFALCGVDRASTEASNKQLSAHMCVLLIRKSLLRKGKKVFLFGKELDLEFYRQFVEHHPEEPKEFSIVGHNEEIPNILVCEGTGFVKSIFSKESPKSVKDDVSLQEAVKDRVYMLEGSIPFYLYVFEILFNDIIDFGLMNVQSFVLTYDPQQNSKIIEGAKDDSFIYGVKVEDMLKHPEDIVFVATPLIQEDHMNVSKKLAKLQFPYPYTSLSDAPSKYERHELPVTRMYVKDEVSPIMSDTEWLKLVSTYKNEIITIEELRKNQLLSYLLCPPRSLETTLSTLNDAGYNTKLQFLKLLSDMFVVVIWIKM